jgi:4-amino-4-deoxy-L-arabinose transferase-like glycosyltransferase
MNRILATIALIIPLVISLIVYPDGAVAVLSCLPLIGAVVFFLKKQEMWGEFLIKIFVAAFLVRMVVATIIYTYNLQPFFGEDSLVHEFHGFTLYQYWQDIVKELPYYLKDWNKPWGLHYLIAATYSITGRSALTIQFFSGFCGSLIAVLIFFTTYSIFRNTRAAKIAALLTAFSPAMIIWSSQIMKDGFVTFFVVLTIYFLLKLQKKFSWFYLAFLLFALFGIFSIRFYIFYFAALACIGSFVFGSERILANNIRWLVIMTVLLIGMSYAGVLSIGTEQLEKLSDLESLQYSREVLARGASSGFSENTDITTTTGAVTALPIGFLYLMLAPFPWHFGSLRASLPLPEMLIWWALIPSLIVGFIYTVRNRFQQATPVLLFTITLTIAYSLFQTNVGTAYRQRTQIQVFLFMFIAVGWTIWQEKKEIRSMLRQMEKERYFRKTLT